MSAAESAALAKRLLHVAQGSYRNIVDITLKMSQSRVDLTQPREATTALNSYQSDHIRFLQIVNKLMKGDKILIRTILQALTQICGPIGFELFAKICHCLLLAKTYVKEDRGNDFKAMSSPRRDNPTRNDSAKLLEKPLTTMME